MTGTGLKKRAGAFAGALAIQAAFLALFVFSMPALLMPSRFVAHEIILVLQLRHPITAAPQVIDARAKTKQRHPLPEAPPTLNILPNMQAPPAADTNGMGRALFGCAPENWATQDAAGRAACAGAMASMGKPHMPDLLATPPPVKDQDYWQEKYDEAHWQPAPCLPGSGLVFDCLFNQLHQEQIRAKHARAHVAAQQAATLAPAKPLPEVRVLRDTGEAH